jgi:hypothetical protein
MEIWTLVVYMTLYRLVEMLGNDIYTNKNDSDIEVLVIWPRWISAVCSQVSRCRIPATYGV